MKLKLVKIPPKNREALFTADWVLFRTKIFGQWKIRDLVAKRLRGSRLLSPMKEVNCHLNVKFRILRRGKLVIWDNNLCQSLS